MASAKLLNALPYLKPIVCSKVDLVLEHDDSPIMSPFISGIIITYLVDMGNKFQYIQERDVKNEEKFSFFAKALSNLSMLEFKISKYHTISAVFSDGNFESTLMLDHRLKEKMAENHLGTVIAAPTRDVLAFASIEDNDGINELRALVERVWPKADHQLTNRLIAFKNDEYLYYDAQQ